jgi:phosphoribosyl-AMP cyclohydrolase
MVLFKSKKQSTDRTERDEFIIDDEHKIVFNSSGLIPVVIQDDKTSEVLKLGYLNKWAVEMSINDKKVYLFRRSLQRLEAFGENHGLEYEISTIKLDRNRRSILFRVIPKRLRRMDRYQDSPQDRSINLQFEDSADKSPEASGKGEVERNDRHAKIDVAQTDFLHLIYSSKNSPEEIHDKNKKDSSSQ